MPFQSWSSSSHTAFASTLAPILWWSLGPSNLRNVLSLFIKSKSFFIALEFHFRMIRLLFKCLNCSSWRKYSFVFQEINYWLFVWFLHQFLSLIKRLFLLSISLIAFGEVSVASPFLSHPLLLFGYEFGQVYYD